MLHYAATCAATPLLPPSLKVRSHGNHGCLWLQVFVFVEAVPKQKWFAQHCEVKSDEPDDKALDKSKWQRLISKWQVCDAQ